MNKQGFKRRRREIFSKLRIVVFLAFIFILPIKPLFAQVFPVQAYINVTPPYSVYLSQYTASDQEKILATILLRDPVITSIDVKFRFTIQGAGIKLTTNPSWNPAPYNLVSGLSVILPQDMIADYLKPQHLLIEGIDQQEFYRSGKLPEGYYQFKVEVIEYRRNITISNTAQAGLWLMLNEPPRIVFPLPNQKVMATNPQMINFTWVPGGVSSPQSSLTTQYEFTLVELADKSVDPYIAITTASNATKYVKTLDQTNLFYGPGEMQLTPGKSYAIRVRAYTTDGFDMFKNNGYSDVRVFTFGDACAAPVSFTLQNPNQSSFEVSVVTDPTNTAWQARFRESSAGLDLQDAGADLQSVPNWSELKSEPGTNIKTIRGLKASTSYDVQIKGLCGDIPSDYSLTQTIKTTEMVNANRSCNNSASTFIAKNAPALTNLKKDDVFLAGLFPIKVKSVTSQGGGKFSGLGIATLPLFNTGIGVTFDNVGINDLMQLTSGEVKGVRDQFNITLFGDSQTTTGGGSGNPTGGQTTGGATYPPIIDTVTIPSVYDSIVIVDNNTILVYTPTGTQTYTVNLGGNSSTLVVPANGNMDNAKIIYDNAVHPYTPGQGGSMNTEPKDFKGFIAYFTDKYQLHGFDTLYPGISKLANYYKQFPIAGKQFYVPWKALKVDQPEPIDLSIKQGTDKLPFSSVKVKQLYIGDITPSGGAGTQNQTFMVKGSYKGAEDNVIAYYNADDKEQIAGGIYLATYGEEKFKLILVPLLNVTVDNIKIGGLQQELNQIYSQAVVSWNVSQFNGFAGVDLGENGLDWADKDMLSSYNPEMNSLISAFRDWKNDADPDAYYLFVVPKFSEENVEGFMPRNRRFGFVTKNQLDARTIAHELGHGAFNLFHTFSTNGWGIAEKSTNNLMDYNNGSKLLKPQWDLIHNPEFTTGLWDGMEDGAYYSTERLLELLKAIKSNNAKRVNGGSASFILKEGVVKQSDISDAVFIQNYFSTFSFSPIQVMDVITDESIKNALKSKSNFTNLTPVPNSTAPVGDENPILLAKEMKVSFDATNTFTITMNGYSLTDYIVTTYASKEVITGGTKYTFYNAKMAPSNVPNQLGESNVLNNRKAFEIIVHEDMNSVVLKSKQFESYINLKGIIQPDEDIKTINIIVERLFSNDFITIGEIRLEGTDLKGYTLELGKGTDEQCKKSCVIEKQVKFECKRIPKGTYKFKLNTSSTAQAGQHSYKSLWLENTNVNGSERDGILVHRGDAYSWTQGCILAMSNDDLESIKQDPDSFISGKTMGFNNINYQESQVFVYMLYDYLKKIDPDGSKTKTIEIKDNDSKQLSVNTTTFQLRQRAGQLYYSLNIDGESDAVIQQMAKDQVDNLLTTLGVKKAVEDKLAALKSTNVTDAETIKKALGAAWDAEYEKQKAKITAEIVKGKIERSKFLENLKDKVLKLLTDKKESNASEVVNYMFLETNYKPYSPIKTFFDDIGFKDKLKIKIDNTLITNEISNVKESFISSVKLN